MNGNAQAPTDGHLRRQTLCAGNSKNQDDLKLLPNIDTNATKFEDLANYAYRIGVESFCQIFPYPFLIQKSGLLLEADSRKFTLLASDCRSQESEALFSPRVYRIVKKTDNSFPHMITVGRSNNNDIHIGDHYVSKFHAHFTKQEDCWFVTDTGSTNGTFVNQRRLEQGNPSALESNSTIAFSDYVEFLFAASQTVFDYIQRYKTLQ